MKKQENANKQCLSDTPCKDQNMIDGGYPHIFISPQKYMLWVLIRSASLMEPTTCFHEETRNCQQAVLIRYPMQGPKHDGRKKGQCEISIYPHPYPHTLCKGYKCNKKNDLFIEKKHLIWSYKTA